MTTLLRTHAVSFWKDISNEDWNNIVLAEQRTIREQDRKEARQRAKVKRWEEKDKVQHKEIGDLPPFSIDLLYGKGALIQYEGSAYEAKKDIRGEIPENSKNWRLVASKYSKTIRAMRKQHLSDLAADRKKMLEYIKKPLRQEEKEARIELARREKKASDRARRLSAKEKKAKEGPGPIVHSFFSGGFQIKRI